MNEQPQVDLVSAALVECQGKLKSATPYQIAAMEKKIINFHIPLKRSGFCGDMDYFWARIYKAPSGCWLWRGGLDRAGYGTTKKIGHPKAHRFSWSLGRNKPSGVRGEAHGNTTLTELQVREIRRLRSDGNLTYRAIGKAFLIAPQTAFQICKLQRWGHVI